MCILYLVSQLSDPGYHLCSLLQPFFIGWNQTVIVQVFSYGMLPLWIVPIINENRIS